MRSRRLSGIGAVVFESGKPIGEFQRLVNSDVEILEKVSKVTHITWDMLVKAPSLSMVFR